MNNQLMTYANNEDSKNVKAILYEDHRINIIQLINAKQYTLLHLSCYNNNQDLSELYLNYLQSQMDHKLITLQQVTEYVNLQNDEGFTALQLAAYRGNLRVIELLEQYGANYLIRNFNDLTALHTSAQGDSPLTIYYYLQKGINIDTKDNKGSTPLHWAAYSGSFYSVAFLISWGASLNAQDTETGVTPLHLAAMQGNQRIVRKLLLKGSDRTIKDITGKTALDIAEEQDFKAIVTMIRDKMGPLEYCNVRQPFRPIVKRERSLIAFLIMYLTAFTLTILFTFPYVKDTTWLYCFFIFTSLTVIFFVLAWLKDPGFVEIKNVDMLSILKRFDSQNICPDCKLVRPKRSKHCDVCQRCVSIYDHHCPWINNCVGQGNIFVFYCFIFFLFIELIMQICMQAEHIAQLNIYRFHTNNPQGLKAGKIFTFVYVMLYCVLFLFPIGILLYHQTMNLIYGKTTFERHSMGASEDHTVEKVERVKYDNCFSQCCPKQKHESSDYIEL